MIFVNFEHGLDAEYGFSAKIVCDMDLIDEKFPHYNEEGRALIRRAWAIASDALKDDLRDCCQQFSKRLLPISSSDSSQQVVVNNCSQRI